MVWYGMAVRKIRTYAADVCCIYKLIHPIDQQNYVSTSHHHIAASCYTCIRERKQSFFSCSSVFRFRKTIPRHKGYFNWSSPVSPSAIGRNYDMLQELRFTTTNSTLCSVSYLCNVLFPPLPLMNIRSKWETNSGYKHVVALQCILYFIQPSIKECNLYLARMSACLSFFVSVCQFVFLVEVSNEPENPWSTKLFILPSIKPLYKWIIRLIFYYYGNWKWIQFSNGKREI